MSIDWNTIYQQEYAKFPDMAGLLEQQEDSVLLNSKREYDTGSSRLQSQLRDALTAAYVTGELAKRDLATRLAAQGISGGMTETAAGDILRNRRNADNAAQKSYDLTFSDLTNAYNKNTSDTRANYGLRIAQAQADRVNNATANANARYDEQLRIESQKMAKTASGKR